MVGAIFKDNREVKNFIFGLLDKHPDLFCIPVSEDGSTISAIDRSVYSANRQMRMLHCAKKGETDMERVFRPAHDTLTNPSKIQRRRYLHPLGNEAESLLQASLVCPPWEVRRNEYKKILCYNQSPLPPRRAQGVGGVADRNFSPFPLLDDLVCSYLPRSSGAYQKDPVITRCTVLGPSRIGYDTTSRWCGNIGRCHKRNTAWYLIDLEMGVAQQRCYDALCAKYCRVVGRLCVDQLCTKMRPGHDWKCDTEWEPCIRWVKRKDAQN